MKNIRLTLEYDGAGYAGWQWQPDVKTLQGALEDAIRKTTGEELRVTASGRTDAGVHAYGQVVSFITMRDLDTDGWRGALNHFLPDDMRVLECVQAHLDFSARYSAKGKRYDYLVLNRPAASPLMRGRAWHVSAPLDVDAMRRAAACLLGEHDFSSFQAAGCSADSPVRTLRSLDIGVEDDDRGRVIVFSLDATAFLRHMVRNIVGTLVEAGRGYIRAGDVEGILAAKDRTKAGPTAPPQGLYLVKVYY